MSIAAVFQIGSLGDTIVSIPALQSVRELLPGCSEYILVSRFETALNVTPSHVFDMAWQPHREIRYLGAGAAWQKIASRTALLARIRYYRPQYAVYLMPVDRSRSQIDRDKLFFRAAGVRELVGFRPFSESELASGNQTDISGTQAYLRFRRLWNELSDQKFQDYKRTPLLIPCQEARSRVHSWLLANRRFQERRLITLSPYSNSSSKSFSNAVITELIGRLEARLGVEVVVLGGKKDQAVAEAACSNAGAGRNACGVFSLEESAALLQMCALAVCVDSGPMHLAGALGIPCVVAFSRMNKQLGRWFPLGTGHTMLYRDVACAGCRLTECDVEGHPCIGGITTDQLLAAASEKLNGREIDPAMWNGTRVLNWPPARELQPC